MKSLTIRLPEALAAQLEAESRERRMSKSDIVCERLQPRVASEKRPAAFDGIADLIGSLDGLPADVSARKKHYLKTTGYGRLRPR